MTYYVLTGEWYSGGNDATWYAKDLDTLHSGPYETAAEAQRVTDSMHPEKRRSLTSGDTQVSAIVRDFVPGDPCVGVVSEAELKLGWNCAGLRAQLWGEQFRLSPNNSGYAETPETKEFFEAARAA